MTPDYSDEERAAWNAAKRATETAIARAIFEQTVHTGEDRYPDYTIDAETGKHRPVPHYRSDLTAAWRIVERLRAWGYAAAITAEAGGLWRATFSRDNAVYDAEAETAAWAICEAALMVRAAGTDAGEGRT